RRTGSAAAGRGTRALSRRPGRFRSEESGRCVAGCGRSFHRHTGERGDGDPWRARVPGTRDGAAPAEGEQGEPQFDRGLARGFLTRLMHIEVVTLFPELIRDAVKYGVLG